MAKHKIDKEAVAAVTAEDLAFDRELERLGQERGDVLPSEISDREPVRDLKPEIVHHELLSEVDHNIKPATTLQELQEQVHLAKMSGCDSVEAELQLIQRICRDPAIEAIGYFMFHDIKVFVPGKYAAATKRDRLTIEQKVFGGR